MVNYNSAWYEAGKYSGVVANTLLASTSVASGVRALMSDAVWLSAKQAWQLAVIAAAQDAPGCVGPAHDTAACIGFVLNVVSAGTGAAALTSTSSVVKGVLDAKTVSVGAGGVIADVITGFRRRRRDDYSLPLARRAPSTV